MNSNKSKLVMALAMTIFGTIGIFRRFIPLSSEIIALVRGAVGTLVLLLFVFLSKRKLNPESIKNNLFKLIVSGALIGFNWIFLFEAYEYTTVAIATLCYYMAPVLVMIMAPFVLKEKLTCVKGLCILISFVGMVLVSGVFGDSNLDRSSYKGIIFGLIAALMYAIVIIINKKINNIGAFDKTIMQLGTAAVVLLPYVILAGNLQGVELNGLSVAMLLFVGIVHTGVAYALYFGSMDGLSADSIAIFSYIDPVVAIILSATLLKEHLGLLEIVGAVMILGATLWSEKISGKDN